MNRIKYIIPILIILLTGCSNYRELTDIAITTAIAVDYSSETDEYLLTTQIVNAVKQDNASASNEPTFINFSSKASSLTEAINKIVLESPKKLYTSQTQLIVLSKEIINTRLNEVLDYFIRNPEIRGETLVVLAPSKEDLQGITIQTLLDNLSSSNIILSLKESEKKGYTILVKLDNLLDMYLNPYKEIILPTIYVEGKENVGSEEENRTSTIYKETVKIGKVAFFKDTTFLDYLSIDESKYLNIIRGELKNTSLKLEYNDGYIVYELYDINSKLVPKIENNTITLTIKGKAKSYEIITNTNIEKPNKTKDIQKHLNSRLEENIEIFFNNIKDKYNTDIFNIRDIYYKDNHKYLKNNYNNWDNDIYPKLNFKVKAELELYEKGKIKEEIKYVTENR